MPDPFPAGEGDDPVELFDHLGNPLNFDDPDATGKPTLTVDRRCVQQPAHPGVTTEAERKPESDQEWDRT